MKNLDGPALTTVAHLRDHAAERGCMLLPEQMEQFEVLAEWLAERAAALGLSQYRDVPVVLTAALAPTFALWELMDMGRICRVMDLGAGSGALGLTLAIAQPHLAVDLVDRRAKAATFLELTAQRLGVGNICVICGEARELATSYAHKYDLVCFRALAAAETALGRAYPFLQPEGHIAAWHQTDDPAFLKPSLALGRIGTAPTAVAGLAVSLYERTIGG